MQKRLDVPLFLTVIFLSCIGLLMIYSSSYIWAEYKFEDSFFYVKHQSVFLILGLFLMMIISKIPFQKYYEYSNVILGVSLLLLILVLIPGIGSIRNGSRSWFGIGSFGIQPSEAAKISLIIFTSKYLSNSSSYMKSYFKGVFPVLCISFLCFGLIMLQPDLGTGMILMMSVIALLFISGVSYKFFFGGGILGILGIIGLILMAPYRLNRITSFFNPWKDSLGTGFQMIQSLYAIGPSGILGTGYLQSIQKHFYLPEPQTDFIFSILAEEFGMIGVVVVVSLFGFLFYRGIKIAYESTNLFGKYLSFGIIFQLIFQTIMNLMVVVGLIPITGVTLPFISYGGSSLLVSMCSMGILLNISKNMV